jgi:hypothetical protein
MYTAIKTSMSWKNMTLLERLNYKCDKLAKYAVSRGIIECPIPVDTDRQRLPLESVALYYNGSKISGECGREIRFQIGKVKARVFYITQLGWYATAFDNVDWESRDKALHGKPDMFKMWLFKQSSSFCATGKNMGRWFGSEHTSYVPTVVSQMKTLYIFYTVVILGVSACFDLR